MSPVSPHYRAGEMGKRIPDTQTSSIFMNRSFNLIGSRCSPPDEIRWKSLSSDDHDVLLNQRRSSFYFCLILSLNVTHKIGRLKDLTIEDFLTILLIR